MDSTTKVLIVAGLVAAAVLAVAVGLLVRLVRTRRHLRRAGLPTGPRWVFWGAVLYLVLPTDLVPDPVYLDDIGVLLLALRTLRGSADVRLPRPARGPLRFGRSEQPGPGDYAP
ncbi:YkvA family protein [Streptomyces sp. NPDC003697]